MLNTVWAAFVHTTANFLQKQYSFVIKGITFANISSTAIRGLKLLSASEQKEPFPEARGIFLWITFLRGEAFNSHFIPCCFGVMGVTCQSKPKRWGWGGLLETDPRWLATLKDRKRKTRDTTENVGLWLLCSLLFQNKDEMEVIHALSWGSLATWWGFHKVPVKYQRSPTTDVAK